MYDVVLDTNVLVAAAMSNRGSSAELLRALADGRFTIAVSAPMVLEYEEVLLRMSGATAWDPAAVADVLEFIARVGRPVLRLPFRLRPFLRDADDEFVLELAVAAGVDYLVSGNVRDFRGSDGFGVTVITPGKFLELLREDP